METTTKWLADFNTHWLNKDLDLIMNLFSSDFIYFETPYQKITDKNILRKEWEYILDHKIKTLDLDVYVKSENKLSVRFNYEYNLNGDDKQFTGVYLIELKKEKCKYFYQVGE